MHKVMQGLVRLEYMAQAEMVLRSLINVHERLKLVYGLSQGDEKGKVTQAMYYNLKCLRQLVESFRTVDSKFILESPEHEREMIKEALDDVHTQVESRIDKMFEEIPGR